MTRDAIHVTHLSRRLRYRQGMAKRTAPSDEFDTTDDDSTTTTPEADDTSSEPTEAPTDPHTVDDPDGSVHHPDEPEPPHAPPSAAGDSTVTAPTDVDHFDGDDSEDLADSDPEPEDTRIPWNTSTMGPPPPNHESTYRIVEPPSPVPTNFTPSGDLPAA